MIGKVLFFMLLSVVGLAQAQGLDNFKDALSQSADLNGASVEIYESQSAKEALNRIGQNSRKRSFLGYRIGIFFDNGASARDNANEAKTLFEENFPNEKLYMVYENPYFKVSVGNCVTQEEAVILLDKVQKVFPKAYLMREQMNVTDIIVEQRSADEESSESNELNEPNEVQSQADTNI